MTGTNPNARLEAFCDGVFAIALTLLIIDVRVPEGVNSATDLWRALRHLAPTIFAFVLSFAIVLITWVNHHETLRTVHTSSGAFTYANGFLLLTVVFIPFPTALLGRYIWTDQAAPAVVLYDFVLATQAAGWLLMSSAALAGRLVAEGPATAVMRRRRRNAVGALVLYGLLAIAALWLPVTVAIVTTGTWVIWLVMSFRGAR